MMLQSPFPDLFFSLFSPSYPFCLSFSVFLSVLSVFSVVNIFNSQFLS